MSSARPRKKPAAETTTRVGAKEAAVGGAGGHWKTIACHRDPRVEKQADPLGCGRAAGVMLARELGLRVTQDDFKAVAGDGPMDHVALTHALNHFAAGKVTFASYHVELAKGAHPDCLAVTCAVMLYEEGMRWGHWVVVRGRPDGNQQLEIWDPQDGERYLMTLAEFRKVCTGITIRSAL